MKLYCAMCGRVMFSAAVYVGSLPVGPTCARKHKLIELARIGVGSVKMAPVRKKPARQGDTLDMFEELENDTN